jgi:protein-S-isoprenylcysteine O-methyltransferase Ste14
MAEPKKFDLVYRGTYGNDLLGNLVFVMSRGLDPFLQRRLLLHSPVPRIASRLGWSLSAGQVTGGAALQSSGLSPFQTLIWAMSIGSAAKQIFWKFTVAREPIYPSTAVAIAIMNTVLNGLNTLVFSVSDSNPAYFPPWSIYAGTALYITGILTETVSELQRNSFKKDPKNEGKVYTGGLFSIARHISYTGYSLWRAGFATAAGGPLWGLFVLAFFLRDFATRAVPVLDTYMAQKYGEQWASVKQKVPYALIPGIW